MSQSKIGLPTLNNVRDYIKFKSQFTAFLATKRLANFIVQPCEPPPGGNANAKAIEDFWNNEMETYGYVVSALSNMSELSQKVSNHQSVRANNRLRGSKAFLRLEAEVQGGGDVNAIFDIQMSTNNCKQDGKTPGTWLTELDGLFGLLPTTEQYNDAMKKSLIMRNCDAKYRQWMAERSATTTWSDICRSMPTYASALKLNEDANNNETIAVSSSSSTASPKSTELHLLEQISSRLEKLENEANLSQHSTKPFKKRNRDNSFDRRNRNSGGGGGGNKASGGGGNGSSGNKSKPYRKGIICHLCKKEGHFQRDCNKRKKT